MSDVAAKFTDEIMVPLPSSLTLGASRDPLKTHAKRNQADPHRSNCLAGWSLGQDSQGESLAQSHRHREETAKERSRSSHTPRENGENGFRGEDEKEEGEEEEGAVPADD